MPQQAPVIVRKAARFDVAIRGMVSVSPAHGQVVRFSAQAGGKDGWIEMDAVDFSLGGVGMVCLEFVPRGTVVRVRLFGPKADSGQILECAALVRRVIMTDRRPAYHIGTSFQELSEEQLRQAQELISVLESGDASPTRVA